METREIPPEDWLRFFDDFSKQHEGWIVTWEVLGPDLGDQEKTAGLPLVGVSADVKGRAPRINVMVGDRLDAHVTHIIEAPKRVWFKPDEHPGHEAIEIESSDGRLALLSFQHIDPEVSERLLPRHQ
jgi:hypothetical protein